MNKNEKGKKLLKLVIWCLLYYILKELKAHCQNYELSTTKNFFSYHTNALTRKTTTIRSCSKASLLVSAFTNKIIFKWNVSNNKKLFLSWPLYLIHLSQRTGKVNVLKSKVCCLFIPILLPFYLKVDLILTVSNIERLKGL